MGGRRHGILDEDIALLPVQEPVDDLLHFFFQISLMYISDILKLYMHIPSVTPDH